jgi:iron(III) transport system substrate-binding protein
MKMRDIQWLRSWLIACVFLMAGPVASSAWAQVPIYEGADRTQRLLDGARREGTLTVYTSMAEKDTARLVSAFEKKHGIKVSIWRSGKHKVLQRVITEARAGRNEVDFVLNPSPEMEALHREKLLQPVRSPMQKELIPAALPAHGEWTGMRVYVFVQGYNTQKVKREELPKTYEDLLHPRWKGRLGIEAKEQEWFYTIVQSMGEERGLRFFHDLVATNGLSVRSGNSLLNNMVVSGEVPFALTLYSYLPQQAKTNGAPIDYIALSPTIAYTDGIAIARNAPHPHAATLFYDFMLSDGQKIVSQHNAITTNRRDEAVLARFKPIYIDPPRVLDSYEKWTQLFDDTLQGRAPRPTAKEGK